MWNIRPDLRKISIWMEINKRFRKERNRKWKMKEEQRRPENLISIGRQMVRADAKSGTFFPQNWHQLL